MRNYFIFNGRDSRDFGVYISGQGTFSAPQKAYQFYNIPGRNGALIGYDNRFENINISYEAFIYKDFDKNLAAFRSFLLSVPGYARLEDSYHTDEYRVAVYIGPFEPEVTAKNDAGSFTITFNCKPQRYLKNGDATIGFEANKTTVSGKELYLYGPSIDTGRLAVKIPVVQEGSGDPSYRNPRPIKIWDYIDIQLDGALFWSRSFTGNNRLVAGTVSATSGQVVKTWDFKIPVTPGSVQPIWTETSGNGYVKYTRSNYWPDVDPDTVISSHFSRGTDPEDPNVFTWYDGQFDMDANGGITIWSSTLLSANALNDYLLENEVTFAGELKTSTTQSGTAFSPSYPNDWCSIVSDGEIFVRYREAIMLYNPTPFESKPLIRMYGTGTFTLNGITVTVSSAGTYTDIDCEMMDCYEGDANRNKNVTFSTYDFPVMVPGTNTISSPNLVNLEIIPRWWRL